MNIEQRKTSECSEARILNFCYPSDGNVKRELYPYDFRVDVTYFLDFCRNLDILVMLNGVI